MEKITSQTWDQGVLRSEKPVVVDFYTEWCSPCRMMKPSLEKVAKRRDDVSFKMVDVEENRDLASEHGVSSIPTLIFVKGGKEVKRLVGLQGEKDLDAAMECFKP